PALTAPAPLSLHDALPIFRRAPHHSCAAASQARGTPLPVAGNALPGGAASRPLPSGFFHGREELPGNRRRRGDGHTACTSGLGRSEEHTSELQSRENLVCR